MIERFVLLTDATTIDENMDVFLKVGINKDAGNSIKNAPYTSMSSRGCGMILRNEELVES